jgi:hypothetical protein
MQNRRATARLSHDRDVVLSPAEEVDVVLDPLEGEALVEEGDVGVAVGEDGGAIEPAEGAEAVVEGDEDEVLVEGGLGVGEDAGGFEAGGAGAVLGAEDTAAAVDLFICQSYTMIRELGSRGLVLTKTSTGTPSLSCPRAAFSTFLGTCTSSNKQSSVAFWLIFPGGTIPPSIVSTQPSSVKLLAGFEYLPMAAMVLACQTGWPWGHIAVWAPVWTAVRFFRGAWGARKRRLVVGARA